MAYQQSLETIDNITQLIYENPEQGVAMFTQMLLDWKAPNVIKYAAKLKQVEPFVHAIEKQKDFAKALATEKIAEVGKKLAEPIKTVVGRSQGIIRTYSERAFKIEHIFSSDHVRDGIMSLGKSKEDILESTKKIIGIADMQGMLKEGANIIKTTINNNKAEIRLYIKDGIVQNVNLFKGYSNRIMENATIWL